jgi:sugar phosphate isomerase/epimerase
LCPTCVSGVWRFSEACASSVAKKSSFGHDAALFALATTLDIWANLESDMTDLIIGHGSSAGGVGGSVEGLAKSLARIKAAGATHAELSTSSLHVTIGGRDNMARIAAVAKLCDASGLRFTLHAPIAINFMDEAHLALHQEVMQSSIRFAAAIGASVVVIHPGRVTPREDVAGRARLLRIERDQVLAAADIAGRHGIRIGLENLNPNRDMMAGLQTSYALDPAALAEQIATIDHQAVCGVLDFAHGWLAATRLRFDYAAHVRAFAPYVGHLHVTDNCGAPLTAVYVSDADHVPLGMGDLHLPIGWGTVPYDTLLADLPIRPGSIANLELGGAYASELEASIAATADIARRLNTGS